MLTQRNSEKTGGKNSNCWTWYAYLLIDPSAVEADDGCLPSDVSMAAQHRETDMKQGNLSGIKQTIESSQKRTERGKITLRSFRGSGGDGASLGGVHGGDAAGALLGLVLLDPILRHGCAACASSSLLGFRGVPVEFASLVSLGRGKKYRSPRACWLRPVGRWHPECMQNLAGLCVDALLGLSET